MNFINTEICLGASFKIGASLPVVPDLRPREGARGLRAVSHEYRGPGQAALLMAASKSARLPADEVRATDGAEDPARSLEIESS